MIGHDPSPEPQQQGRCLLGLGGSSEDGTVIVQIDPKEYEQVELKNLIESEERKYGNTLLIFFDRA